MRQMYFILAWAVHPGISHSQRFPGDPEPRGCQAVRCRYYCTVIIPYYTWYYTIFLSIQGKTGIRIWNKRVDISGILWKNILLSFKVSIIDFDMSRLWTLTCLVYGLWHVSFMDFDMSRLWTLPCLVYRSWNVLFMNFAVSCI